MSKAIALAIVLTLGSSRAAQQVQLDDRYYMAKAVQGEVGVMGDLRLQTGTWIVHVILNRQASRWFPSQIKDVVDQGFYGAATIAEPDPWAYEVVDFALLERSWGLDPTRGALFVFGGIDLLECMDYSLRVGYAEREGTDFSVHVFSTWPYPAGCAR